MYGDSTGSITANKDSHVTVYERKRQIANYENFSFFLPLGSPYGGSEICQAVSSHQATKQLKQASIPFLNQPLLIERPE